MADAAEGVDETSVGQGDRHRVDREVPSREVGPDVLREGHRRLAVPRVVDLLAEGRDLEAAPTLQRPDRPEPHAHQVPAFRPSANEARGLVWCGVGREVEVRVRRQTSEHQIADDAAHQVELVPRCDEALTELPRERVDLHDGAAVARRLRRSGHDRSRIPRRCGRSARVPCPRAHLARVHLDAPEHADRPGGGLC